MQEEKREEDAVTAIQYALRQMDDGRMARRLVRSTDIERLLAGEDLNRLLPTGVLVRSLSSADEWRITDEDRRIAEETRKSVGRDEISEEYVILTVTEEEEERRIEMQPASARDVMRMLKDPEIEDAIRKAEIPSIRGVLEKRHEMPERKRKNRHRGGDRQEK